MTTATMEPRATVAAPKDPDAPAASQMVHVARKYGVSPLTQMREMFALRHGPGKIALPEYYALGLYTLELSMAQKREHVGRISNWKLNDAMNIPRLTESRVFCNDKVMYTALLRQLGFPTTETQAVLHKSRGFGDQRVLRDRTALRRFLSEEARYPLFGKPAEGRAAIGSAMMLGVEGDAIRLSDGRLLDLDRFCDEIWSNFHDGYLLQTCLEQHAALRSMSGNAVSTLRLVTVRDGDTASVFYTLWKVPSPKAMSDNFWQSGSIATPVDADGRVGCGWYGMGCERRKAETHPASGERFDSVVIPDFADYARMACDAHMLFPEFGLVGWDIAITPDGPVMVEFNHNPYHALWQVVHGRGIRCAEMQEKIDRTIARSQAILQGKIDMFKRRQREMGRKV